MPAVWRRHFLGFELLLVAVLTLAFFVWRRYFDDGAVADLLDGNRTAVYGALVAVFGALLGYVMAAVAIVMSVADSPRLQFLRDAKVYHTMWAIFIAAIRALALVTGVSLVALVFDRDSRPAEWVFGPLVFSFSLALLRLARLIWLFEGFIKIMTTGTKPESSNSYTSVPTRQ
ncbi:MAG: hypothetical protein ACK5AZ_24845 [Bryobacteraceae bacterium]